jgi:hypothetical protein
MNAVTLAFMEGYVPFPSAWLITVPLATGAALERP